MKKIAILLVVVVLFIAVTAGAIFFTRGLQLGLWAERRAFEGIGLERRQVETKIGVQTVFESPNESDPTLVMVHGFGDQAATWSTAARSLIDRYHLVVPDLAGHGDSEPTGDTLTFDQLYQAFVDSIEACTGGKPFALMGNSLGGWLSMRYALEQPNRVDQLVLVNSGGLRQEFDREVLIPKTREGLALKLEAAFPPNARMLDLPGFAQDQLIAMVDLPRMHSLFDSLEDRHYLDEKLPALAMPTDLIWGTPDGLIPIEYAHRLNQAIPDSTLHELAGCGHLPQLVCGLPLTNLLEEILQ